MEISLQARAEAGTAAFFRPRLQSCLVGSHWPKHVAWPRPTSEWAGLELPGEDLNTGKGEELLSIFPVHTNINIGKYP